MPLDRRAERLIAMLAATGGQVGEPAAVRRESLRALARMADDAATPARVTSLEAPGAAGPIPLRAYAPEDAGEDALAGLVFFHGGGWVAGDLETHDGLCRRLAVAAGCRLFAVDYRRAPEHPFPAAFDDALAAAAWIAANAAALNIDGRRLAVGGDSVGAGLAAAVAQTLRDTGGPPLAAQLLICPILDPAAATRSRDSFGAGYFISRDAFAQDLGDYLAGAPIDPRLAPARTERLAALPPAIVHTAEYDPFRDEGEDYAIRLRDAGVPSRRTRHAGMIHYFYAMGRAIPYARDAAEMIGQDLRAVLTAPAPVGIDPVA